MEPSKLRDGFVTLAENLLISVSTVFDDCEDTKDALNLFRKMIKGKPDKEELFIKTCHQLFESNPSIVESDEHALFKVCNGLPIMQDLELESKWKDPEFSDESKENLWKYVKTLKTYAELYSCIPQNITKNIERMAEDISRKIVTGDIDLQNLDIDSIGKELMGNLSSEDSQNFEATLPRMFGSISALAGELDVGAVLQDNTRLKQLMASQGVPAVENHEAVMSNLTRQLSNLTVKGDVKEESIIKKG